MPYSCLYIFLDYGRRGIIAPIHNKGPVENVQNHRGITLLSTLGKIFTRIINNRLKYWSDTYHVINDKQSGLRRRMSTVDNIYILQSGIGVAFNSSFNNFAFMRKLPSFINFAFMRNPHVYKH